MSFKLREHPGKFEKVLVRFILHGPPTRLFCCNRKNDQQRRHQSSITVNEYAGNVAYSTPFLDVSYNGWLVSFHVEIAPTGYANVV